MSEEEIIKRLKNIIEINKSFLDCNIKENSNIYKDIQRLLDLYKQAKEKNKELEATLKQTQDSWYEDTKKIELNNECEIALNNRIIDLENELNKEKEKNKKIEEYCRKDLAFEKRLERQNEKPDDYNRGVFNTCFNILELLEERN